MKNLVLFLGLVLTFSFAGTPPATHYDYFPETEPTPYTAEILDFYLRSKPYGEFSNFALFPLFIDGKWWPTSEHYFQAMKYEKEELIEWVRTAATPMEAANRGRDPQVPKRPDWFHIREEVMFKALWDKYTRYEKLKTLLLSTGDARIFEHTKNDCYWGDCGDRTGKNKLGVMLEDIRTRLKIARRAKW